MLSHCWGVVRIYPCRRRHIASLSPRQTLSGVELVGMRRPAFRHARTVQPQSWTAPLPYFVALFQFVGYGATALWKLARFNVASDFGMNNQATFLIRHGVLNPFSTIAGHPMWQDQFKLLLWPVGLLRIAAPGAILLVVLQAAALAASSGLLIHLVQQLSSSLPSRTSTAVIAISAGIILLEPWTYQAALSDFHAQNIAAPALVLLIGSIMLKRTWPWIFGSAAAYLLSGSEAGTVVAAAGFGFLLLREHRRNGALLASLGSLWIGLILLLHADLGTPFDQVYGYLAGSAHPTLPGILSGVIHTPMLPLRQLASHGITIAALIIMAGSIGIFYPPAGAVACCEILLAGLQQHTNLLDFATGSFQMWPVVALLICGIPPVIVRLSRWKNGRSPQLQKILVSAAAALGICTVLGNGYYSMTIPARWNTVPNAAVRALQQDIPFIPTSAEVIASNGIIGVLSARSYVYALTSLHEVVPICSSKIFIVIAPSTGAEMLPPSSARELAASLHPTAFPTASVSGSALTVLERSIPHPGYSWLAISPQGASILHSSSRVSCPNPLIP